MSDHQIETSRNEQSVEEMQMPDLRRLATTYGIKANRDWNRDDFIAAINNRRQRHEAIASPVFDSSVGPAPGKARIKIFNTQTGSNHPVPVAINNYIAKIPRDVEVDVPLEVVEVLNQSKTPVRVKDPSGAVNPETGKPKLVWRDVLSYPFQMIAMTPGVAMKHGVPMVRSSSNKAKHSLKLKFREIYQRWPKRAELKQFQDAHLAHKAKKVIAAEELELAENAKNAAQQRASE